MRHGALLLASLKDATLKIAEISFGNADDSFADAISNICSNEIINMVYTLLWEWKKSNSHGFEIW